MAGIPCEGCPHTFLELLDTPVTYTGSSGRILRVNSSETGLEFVDFAGLQNIVVYETLQDAQTDVSSNYTSYIAENKIFYIKALAKFFYIEDGVNHGNIDTPVSYHIPSRPGVLKDALLPYFYISSSGTSGHSPADPITIDDFITTYVNSSPAVIGPNLKDLVFHILDSNISATASPTATLKVKNLHIFIDESLADTTFSFSVPAGFIEAENLFIYDASSINDVQLGAIISTFNVRNKLYVWGAGESKIITINESSGLNRPSLSLEIEVDGEVRIYSGSPIVLKEAVIKKGMYLPVASSTNPEDSVNYPVSYLNPWKMDSLVREVQYYLDNKVDALHASAYKIVGRRKVIYTRIPSERRDYVNIVVYKDYYPNFYDYCPSLNLVQQLVDANTSSPVNYYAAVDVELDPLMDKLTLPLIKVGSEYYYYLNLPAGEPAVELMRSVESYEGYDKLIVVATLPADSPNPVQITFKSGASITVNPGNTEIYCTDDFVNTLPWIEIYVPGGGVAYVKEIKAFLLRLK